jgi:hypothetical protein
MFRIIRISGESMSPEYHDEDFVLVSRLPLLLGLVKIDSVLVFRSWNYGLLIKKVSEIDKKNRRFFFTGTNHMSLSTEKIGTIDKKDIIGSVLFHFKKKSDPKFYKHEGE